MLKKLNSEIIFYTILILSFVLRLFHLGDFSFSNDELSSIVRLNYSGFRELISEGIWVDGHPGGVQIFMFYWTKIFGLSEFWVRFPFAIASSAAIFFAYKFAKKISGEFPALLFAVSLGFLEFYMIHSQIARPYSMGLFLAMLNAYLLYIVVECNSENKRKKILNSILLGFIFSLQAYNHYFSGLLAGLMALSALIIIENKNRKYLLISFAIAIVVFSPHIPITLNHLAIGGVGEWLGKPEPSWILEFLLQLFNNSYLIIPAILLLFIYYIFIEKKTQKPKKWQIHSFIWFADSFLIAYFYSIFVNPVLVDRVLIFASPFLIFSFFAFLPSKINFFRLNIVFVFFSIIIIDTFIINKYYKTEHFVNFKIIPELIYEWEEKYNSKDLAVFAHTNSELYIRFYEKKPLNIKSTYNKSREDLKDLKEKLKQIKSEFIVYSEIHNAHHLFEDILKSEFPYEVDYYPTKAIMNIKLLSKNKKFSGINNRNLKLKSEKTKLNFSTEKKYSETLDLNLREDFKLGDLLKIEASIDCKNSSEIKDAAIVFTVNNKNENYWRAAAFDLFNNKIYFDHKYKVRKGDERIKVYIWNNSKELIEIESLDFSIYQILD